MRLLPEKPPNISEHAVRRAWTVVVVLAVIVLIVTVIGLVRLSDSNESLSNKVEHSEAALAKLSKRADDEHAGAQALAEQVERLGGKPVVDPGEPASPIPGPVFATQSQVNEAVSVICGGTRSPCRPTDAQVKTTLRAICGGDCRGEDGKAAKTPEDGKDGEDGEDAPAVTAEQIDAAVARNCGEDGCRGPSPTDEQVDERLAAYCSEHNDCRGKDAVITPSGMDCPEGERVNGVHLLADGSLTVSCAPIIGPSD